MNSAKKRKMVSSNSNILRYIIKMLRFLLWSLFIFVSDSVAQPRKYCAIFKPVDGNSFVLFVTTTFDTDTNGIVIPKIFFYQITTETKHSKKNIIALLEPTKKINSEMMSGLAAQSAIFPLHLISLSLRKARYFQINLIKVIKIEKISEVYFTGIYKGKITQSQKDISEIKIKKTIKIGHIDGVEDCLASLEKIKKKLN